MSLSDTILSANGKERARQGKVVLIDGIDLKYHQALGSHIGLAAKHQLHADMALGEPILALTIRLPAIRAKIADFDCCTFSISLEYLFKASYVSHRSKGRTSDAPTYQRMLDKTRLMRIRECVSADGIRNVPIAHNRPVQLLSLSRGK
jgi:DNA sulfur modification protein DndB